MMLEMQYCSISNRLISSLCLKICSEEESTNPNPRKMYSKYNTRITLLLTGNLIWNILLFSYSGQGPVFMTMNEELGIKPIHKAQMDSRLYRAASKSAHPTRALQTWWPSCLQFHGWQRVLPFPAAPPFRRLCSAPLWFLLRVCGEI